MADMQATTTVEMDEQGRLYIPKAVRKRLGVVSSPALVELEIQMIEVRPQDSDE